jgi:hypothetical protein
LSKTQLRTFLLSFMLHGVDTAKSSLQLGKSLLRNTKMTQTLLLPNLTPNLTRLKELPSKVIQPLFGMEEETKKVKIMNLHRI